MTIPAGALRAALTRGGLSEGALTLRLELTRRIDELRARAAVQRRPELFGRLETLCFFVGYPRSGHSLIGSLIDAHPEALIAHRLDALGRFRRGGDPRIVYYLMMRNAERFGRNGRRLTRYAYPLPKQLQGRALSLRVLGDQEGRKTAERLARDPELVERLPEVCGTAVKLLHVIRNPYDNIATMALRTNYDLAASAARYFALNRGVTSIRERAARAGVDVLDVHYEAFLAEPRRGIEEVFAFVGLDAPPQWVRSVLPIVYRTPHQSRHEVRWNPDLIAAVRERVAASPFLGEYRFDA